MPPPDDAALRLELLRMRAAVERTELVAAVRELNEASRPLRRLAGGAAAVAHCLRARRGAGLASLPGLAVSLLRDRPWLLSALAAAVTRRGLPRWLTLAAVAAAGAWLARDGAGASRDGDAAGPTGS